MLSRLETVSVKFRKHHSHTTLLTCFAVSQYSGAPGYVSVTTAASTVPYSSLPVATYVPAEYVPYNASYANGTSSLCGDYVDGTDINGQSIAGTFYQNGCELVESVWSITAEQLYLWNPSLNTSVSDCALQNETLYCVQQYVVTATQSAYVPLPTAVSQTTIPSNWSFRLTPILSASRRLRIVLSMLLRVQVSLATLSSTGQI